MSQKIEIVCIEDHHQAYHLWKEKGFKNLALIHIDSHLDFAFGEIKEQNLIFREAKSLAELKAHLERFILFKRFKFNKEKLINIRNYIYPAMRDGIVNDFHWVIPGDKIEFKRSLKDIKSILNDLAKRDPRPKARPKIRDGIVHTKLYGQNFFISCLEALPEIEKPILLDIDIDFLVIDSIRRSNRTDEISKRKIWLKPLVFSQILKTKVKNPIFVTIAYSVNGGYTPLKFKYLASEIAASLKDEPFKLPSASVYFELFNKTLKKRYYQQTVKADPSYRAADNNYGPLYLAKKKYNKAESEFKKIIAADPENKDALCGMGELKLARRRFFEAKRYFKKALKGNHGINKVFFGLARAEFRLAKYQRAEEYFLKYQKLEPMQPHSHYFLGQIYEKKNQYSQAKNEYQRALNLGMNDKKIRVKIERLQSQQTNAAKPI